MFLTPGPYNETYFEQAYLARYLGYMLVEGQDLTVRDDRVFLKTLSGLEPVDVILRRVDDDFCDPLELRNDSILGVPGLLEALRAGNVAVANALGSGLLQSPAFMAFLPGLCRHLLGEELKLPSVATWWCGQRSRRAACPGKLGPICPCRPAFRAGPAAEPEGEPNSARTNARHSRAASNSTRICLSPRNRSSFPPRPRGTERTGGAAGRPCGVSGRGGRWLHGDARRIDARWAPRRRPPLISMQHGGASKDTWVLERRTGREVTLLQPGQSSRRTAPRGQQSALAGWRTIFSGWAVTAERADATARLLRSALLRFNPGTTGGALPLLAPLLQTLKSRAVARLSTRPGIAAASAEALRGGTAGRDIRSGLAAAACGTAENIATAGHARAGPHVQRPVARAEPARRAAGHAGRHRLGMLGGRRHGVLNQTLLGLAAFHGLARENMTRAQAGVFWTWACASNAPFICARFWMRPALAGSATIPACSKPCWKWRTAPSPTAAATTLLPNIAAVYDLVLLDDNNPRSVLFQFNQLVKHFERLPRERESALPSAGQRVLLDAWPGCALLDPRDLASREGQLAAQRSRGASSSATCANCPNSPTPSPPVISPIPPSPAPAANKAAMNYRILHRTVYEYTRAGDRFASRRAARSRGRPRPDAAGFRPGDRSRAGRAQERADYFGNRVCFFSIQEIHRRLEITAGSRVTVSRVTPPVPRLSPAGRRWRRCSATRLAGGGRAVSICFDSPLLRAAPELADYALRKFRRRHPLAGRRAGLEPAHLRRFQI